MKKSIIASVMFIFFLCVSIDGCGSPLNNSAQAISNTAEVKESDSESSVPLEIQKTSNEPGSFPIYDNPIDGYFLKKIDESSCEAERRGYQDTYRGVWASEFKNIMRWMSEKCLYQEDKDRLIEYENSIEQLIELSFDIMITNWLDDYGLQPESEDRNRWGNGTRSGLKNGTYVRCGRSANQLMVSLLPDIIIIAGKPLTVRNNILETVFT